MPLRNTTRDGRQRTWTNKRTMTMKTTNRLTRPSGVTVQKTLVRNAVASWKMTMTPRVMRKKVR